VIYRSTGRGSVSAFFREPEHALRVWQQGWFWSAQQIAGRRQPGTGLVQRGAASVRG
jgi:hypothetical protein